MATDAEKDAVVPMALPRLSIWQRLGVVVTDMVESSRRVVDKLMGSVARIPDAEERRAVAFTAAMIALSAKMAKADGVVTADEVDAVRTLFDVPPGEEANVRRLFNLARRDVAGFDQYAKRIRELYPDDPELLINILDALFFIATADGVVHELEMRYLETVAQVFGLEDREFDRLVSRHTNEEGGDPYEVLGVKAEISDDELRKAYRALVAEYHPDRVISRGLPEELVAIANNRLASINGAYARIREQRRI